MKNLAGDKNCDRDIKQELERACIDVVPVDKMDSEVPASTIGRLGPFTFKRAWYYWVVSGPMPLPVAVELHDHPEGRASVRVAGNASNTPPKEPWITWYAQDGAELWPCHQYEDEYERYKDIPSTKAIMDNMITSGQYRVSDNLIRDGSPYIMSYHIDEQSGLLLFSMKVREHKLHENDLLISMMTRINELKVPR